MIRKLSVLLFLMTSIVCMTPGDLFGGDPPISCEPDDNFGDPDDDFQPEDYRLGKDHAGGDTTTSGYRKGIKFKPDPSNAFLPDYWIHLLQGRLSRVGGNTPEFP